MKRCELAVLEELECRMRAHSKVAESARQTQGDTCAMLLARIEKLEERAKAHDELNLAVRVMFSNMQDAKKRQEKLEESLQALAAQIATITAQQQSTDVLAQEQTTALEAQSKALQELKAHMSILEEQQDATDVLAQELRSQMSTLAQQQYAADVLAREHTTAMEAQSKALQAQLNEVTRKHAATDMIAQLAAAHLAGDVPEVAKHIGGDKLNAALVKLRGTDVQQRLDAVEALRRLGGSSPAAGAAARHALVAVLRGDVEMSVRFGAASILGLLPDATLVPPLTTALLEDKDLNVRRNVAQSLGLVGAPAALTAVGALTSAMRKDPDEGVRAAAAGALLALDAQGLTAEAQGVALQVLRSGDHEIDRGCAAWAVGRGRGPEARTALEKAAGGDAHKNVRAAARTALETLRP